MNSLAFIAVSIGTQLILFWKFFFFRIGCPAGCLLSGQGRFQNGTIKL